MPNDNNNQKPSWVTDPFNKLEDEPIFMLKADRNGSISTYGPNISWETAADLCFRGIIALIANRIDQIPGASNLIVIPKAKIGG